MAENKKEKIYIMLAAFLCAASIIAMIIALCTPKAEIMGDFIPPEFESSACLGEPNVPKEFGFSEPYRDGMSFRAAICGNLIIRGGNADIYFTNKPENEVWLMLRITDEKGEILAETGLLRPGEYVKTVCFKKIPIDGQKVSYKIMSYEPEMYFSKGYIVMNTTAHVITD